MLSFVPIDSCYDWMHLRKDFFSALLNVTAKKFGILQHTYISV